MLKVRSLCAFESIGFNIVTMWSTKVINWPCLLLALDLLAKALGQSVPLASILPADLGMFPVPDGPVPAGCSQFEILVGKTSAQDSRHGLSFSSSWYRRNRTGTWLCVFTSRI